MGLDLPFGVHSRKAPPPSSQALLHILQMYKAQVRTIAGRAQRE